ncbi:MAG: PAS domain S-box protein [Nitrospira sp.]|nr:PAS domain S-box protein [Nitrospira sp.]
MSGTGQLPELESLRTQLADVARELAERDRTLYEQTTNRDRQLQDLQEQSVWLRTIVEGTAADIGERFFASLVNQLTSTLQVQYAVIGIVTEAAPHTIHTIAVSSGGTLVRNFEYALSQTPCEAALKESFARFDSQVQDTFPKFELPGGVRIDSYCGVQIRIKSGAVIGILAIMDTKPLRKSEWIQSVLTLFAARAGAELQRQRAEAAQRAAESRLRFTQVAVDQSFDGVLWADDSTRFIYANDAVCRSLGYSREEFLGLTIADIAPCHDPERFQQRLDEIKQGGAATYESVHRRKDGSEFPIEISVTYLEYEGTGYTCGFIRDITERQRVEQERLQALTDLRNITETVPDFMFTLDTQGNMVKWNHRVEEVTGYTPEELHGKSALAFVPPHEQEQTARAIQRAFTDGKAELEGHLITKDQRTIPYHWTGAVLKELHGRIIGITGIGRDVSAQKETAEALQRQQHHLMEAQALAHLGSWEWDIESGDTVWSEEQFRIFGHEPGAIAVTYDTFLAALLPDDHDRVLAAVNDALLGKCPLDLECRIVRPNGDIRVIHMRADVQRDITAHPTAMAGTALDITERKQVEEALRASEERWHLAVQGSNDGIWDWNIQAGEIFFSARWKAMRGFADHEVRNHIDEWRSRIHPDDLDRVLQSIDHYLARQTPGFCEEYRVQRKDGSYMWILDRGTALWAEDGSPVRMAGSETDITEHRQTLLQLEEQDTLLRSILDAEPECVKRVAADGTLLHMNKAGLGFIESDALEQVAGRSVYGLIAPESLEQFRRMHDAVIRGNPQTLEFQVVGLKGRRRWLETHAVPLSNPIEHRVEHLAVTRDVTERKQAEGALRTSQEKLQQALRASHTGLWDWNTDTNEASFSREWKYQLGYEETELTDTFESWESLLHPEDHDRVIAYVQAYLASPEGDYQQEFRLRHKDGSYRWIEARAAFVTETDGRRVRLLGSHTDITKRKWVELALRESEARTRSILETALDAVVSINESGLIMGWNPQAEVLFGYAPHEVLGRLLDETIIPARYRQAHAHGMNRMLQSDDGSAIKRRFEFFALHQSGQEFPVEFAIAASQVDGQRMFTAFIRDISERKRAEEALRESEERYRTLVELSPSGVFVFSEGRTVYVNSMAMTLLGATEPNDILARSPFEFIHPDYHEDVTQNLRRVLAGEATVHRAERVYLKMDGTPLHVQVEAVRITWNGTPAIQGFFSDITERKQMEDRLRTTQYAVDHAADSIFFIGDNGYFLDVNESACRRLGYTKEELLTMSVMDIDPDFLPAVWDSFWEEFKRTKLVHLETKHCSKSGEIYPVEVTANYLLHNGQEIDCAIVRDITERKQAEEALRRSEQQLRTVLDTLPIGVWFTDEKGHVLYGNPVGHRIWAEAARVGLPQPGGDGLWWETIAQPEAPHRWAVGTVLARGHDVQNETLAIETRAGECRTIRNSAVPVKGDAGEMLGAIVLNEDITDRIRAEKALHQEHALLMAVMDAATDIIFVKDLEGRYIHINRAGARALGMPVEEVIGWNDYAIWPSDLAASCQLADRRVLETGEPVTVEETSVCDGVTTIYLTTKAPYRNAEGQIIGVIGVARDITERKQAEEALRASEQLFAKAFRASPNPIGITEVATGRCIDTNQACLDLLGFSREEVVGQTTLMLGIWPNPKDRDMLISRLQSSGAMHNEEMTFNTKSGNRRHVLVSSDLVEMNGMKCLITVGNDITERIRAEEALREQHSLLSAIMNTTMDIIFVKDLDGHYLHMNPAGARVVGLSPQEVVGKDDDAIWPPDLVACCKEADRLILSTGSAQTMEESTIANGKRITYLTTKAPYRDAAGNMIGIIGVAHDISQIKQSEEDLRRSHAFIRQIIDTNPNFIFAKDREGRFTLVNKAVAEAYGTSVEQLIGKTDADFNSNTQELEFFRKKDLEVLNSLREQFIGEEMITDAAGHTRWLQTVKRPILDESGLATMVLGASTDITERKRIEETLRQRERDLRTALDERERISQDLHDGILQSLYAVGLGLEACKPLMTQRHYKKAAASMDRAIGHLNHVMSEVRNFIAGLESQILQGSTFPMALRTMVQTLTANHPIPCTLTIDECLADTFSTEQALHLLNVVREALSNSLRHSEATKTTVSLKSLSRSIRLTIADNGRGFNHASMHGAGHGLTNMEARARKVGGRFAIRSVPQHGTRITIDLPKRSTEGDSPCRK